NDDHGHRDHLPLLTLNLPLLTLYPLFLTLEFIAMLGLLHFLKSLCYRLSWIDIDNTGLSEANCPRRLARYITAGTQHINTYTRHARPCDRRPSLQQRETARDHAAGR